MKTQHEKYIVMKKWRKCNRERWLAYRRKYTAENKKKIKKQEQKNNARIKIETVNKYGGCCSFCQCTNIKVLTVDHINDDGAKLRRNGEKIGHKLYRILLKQKDKRDDLQILCFNCQWRKLILGPDKEKWPTKCQIEYFLAEKIKCDDPRYNKQYNLKIKSSIMSKYGNCCKKCSCEDISTISA